MALAIVLVVRKCGGKQHKWDSDSTTRLQWQLVPCVLTQRMLQLHRTANCASINWITT